MADQITTKLAVRDRLMKVLGEASLQRSQREDIVDTPNGREMGWTVYEREQMLTAVNRVREEYGLPPVDMEAVALIDRTSAGHVDWFEKFTLRCAELAVGEERRG